MNASQLLAWLVCLLIAAGAAVLAVHNSYKLAVLNRRFAQVETAARDHAEVLTDIRDILTRMEASSPSEAPGQ
ncbi:MAG: hypothetical protein GTO48_08135 [Xanthomonadales bacterium]|nr:hypothetical protein [Xanthomonadales bacterium]NIO12717.1 hypothetical protein [Xanthomonadales bacterium]